MSKDEKHLVMYRGNPEWNALTINLCTAILFDNTFSYSFTCLSFDKPQDIHIFHQKCSSNILTNGLTCEHWFFFIPPKKINVHTFEIILTMSNSCNWHHQWIQNICFNAIYKCYRFEICLESTIEVTNVLSQFEHNFCKICLESTKDVT